jgi:hypothetical protein
VLEYCVVLGYTKKNVEYNLPDTITNLQAYELGYRHVVTLFGQNSKSCDLLLQNSTDLGMVILGPFF